MSSIVINEKGRFIQNKNGHVHKENNCFLDPVTFEPIGAKSRDNEEECKARWEVFKSKYGYLYLEAITSEELDELILKHNCRKSKFREANLLRIGNKIRLVKGQTLKRGKKIASTR